MFKQENRAVARKPRDAAAVLFGLKFADNIHYNFRSSQASKARLDRVLQTYWRKIRIRGQVFWSQWEDDKVLSNTVQ